MTAAEDFPPDSDLDLMLVVDRPTITKDPIDELYRGVAIEAGVRGRDEYDSAERVLANPEVADYIAAGAILSDPSGMLASIQPVVARDLASRRWVLARCDDEKLRFRNGLHEAENAPAPALSAANMIFVVVSLSGLIAVAQVVPPTHRKCVVQLREHLRALGRAELHEAVLAAFGVRDMTRARVQSFKDRWGEAFDRAVEVKRTPSPFDFKLRRHLRPYLIDWTQTMIDSGDHREVMPWILGGVVIAATSLLQDAPADERPRYQALVEDLVDETGFATPAARAERFRLAAEAGRELFALADEIVASRPDELVTA